MTALAGYVPFEGAEPQEAGATGETNKRLASAAATTGVHA